MREQPKTSTAFKYTSWSGIAPDSVQMPLFFSNKERKRCGLKSFEDKSAAADYIYAIYRGPCYKAAKSRVHPFLQNMNASSTTQ